MAEKKTTKRYDHAVIAWSMLTDAMDYVRRLGLNDEADQISAIRKKLTAIWVEEETKSAPS